MAPISLAKFAEPPENIVIRLPHPFLTAYSIKSRSKAAEDDAAFQVRPTNGSSIGIPLTEPLHNDSLFFSELVDLETSQRPPESNNTAWARARRSPSSIFSWDCAAPPSFAQIWLIIYVQFTLRPEIECFRLQLRGSGHEKISQYLRTTLLAIPHPSTELGASLSPGAGDGNVVVLRNTFWQGAGSPFGTRPVWLPDDSSSGDIKPVSAYPIAPVDHTLTIDSANGNIVAWHPRRSLKPEPGSVLYSRYIPHLKETFSMVALDYQNELHLNLFHSWQNDPRVSQGWDETGTLDQHREYLRRAHEDPHRITILARFDDTFFAYFEAYWAKEDSIGTYYDADDFDRGRHSLVGDVNFRGPLRVTAWWSSVMHYLFLDDPRTRYVVGEPKATYSTVISYDFVHGFGLEQFVDLPHKRSAFVRCSRQRFFQLAPLGNSSRVIGGTGVALTPKL